MKKIYVKTDTVPAKCDYLTPGKEYEAMYPDAEGAMFYDDHGSAHGLLWTGCVHLNGGSWWKCVRTEKSKELAHA